MKYADLRDYLMNSDNLPQEIQLSQVERIFDVNKFVRSHLAIIDSKIGKPTRNKLTYKPYFDRLYSLYLLIKNDDQ